MLIEVKRTEQHESHTIGEMYVDGKFICYTLEDKDRGLDAAMSLDQIKRGKIYGKTAIPTGTYSVTITYSPLFKKQMPLLTPVKGYEAIRIHPGNTENDTLGCIVVGTTVAKAAVLNSRVAFNKLFPMITKAIAEKKKVSITITRTY